MGNYRPYYPYSSCHNLLVIQYKEFKVNYEKILFDKYETANLTTKQTSEVVGRSVASLEADRRAGEGISFKRLGNKDNSPIRYPLHEISKFLNNVEKVL